MLSVCAHLIYVLLIKLVFGDILPDEEYGLWLRVTKIVECLLGCRRNRVTPEMLSTLTQWIWRHNRLTEEIHGGKSYVNFSAQLNPCC